MKRTKKDYSLSFKLQLVEEIEQGYLTKSQAKLKYGIKEILLYQNGCGNMVTLIGKTKHLQQWQKLQNKE